MNKVKRTVGYFFQVKEENMKGLFETTILACGSKNYLWTHWQILW